MQLPLYGRIAAGLPIEAMRDATSFFEVPVALLGPGEHYALEVAGDSMIDAGIQDGDTVIIRRAETAENGQIVVALVDEEEVTLKRLRRRGQLPWPWSPRTSGTRAASSRPSGCACRGRLVALMRPVSVTRSPDSSDVGISADRSIRGDQRPASSPRRHDDDATDVRAMPEAKGATPVPLQACGA